MPWPILLRPPGPRNPAQTSRFSRIATVDGRRKSGASSSTSASGPTILKANGRPQLWADQKDDLLAGRTPRANRDGLTVRDLCNHFLTAKEQQRDAGDIKQLSFADYLTTGKLLVEAFGPNRLSMIWRPRLPSAPRQLRQEMGPASARRRGPASSHACSSTATMPA